MPYPLHPLCVDPSIDPSFYRPSIVPSNPASILPLTPYSILPLIVPYTLHSILLTFLPSIAPSFDPSFKLPSILPSNPPSVLPSSPRSIPHSTVSSTLHSVLFDTLSSTPPSLDHSLGACFDPSFDSSFLSPSFDVPLTTFIPPFAARSAIPRGDMKCRFDLIPFSLLFCINMDSRLFVLGMDPVYLICNVQVEGLKLVCCFPFAR